jgi:hypothetical protein
MLQENYRSLAEDIIKQQNPDHIPFTNTFSAELSSVNYSDVLYFIRVSMNGVDDAYTQKSKQAGEFVKSHLINGGLNNVDFEYQGSVMTNTHIRGYSNIDLLAISSKFYTYPRAAVNNIVNDYSNQYSYTPSQLTKLRSINSISDYLGDSSSDLKKLRLESESILKNTYSICDISKPKSIKINNTNLKREVDIVIASWYDDIRSIINDRENYRGIQIYHKEYNLSLKADYPFLSIFRINERSSLTSGRLKKMIRFCKNLKSRSNLGIKLNSFDFNAICYDIDTSKYINLSYYQLVYVLHEQISNIITYQSVSDNIVSVDSSEYIFKDKPEKLESLKNLFVEIKLVYNDLKRTAIYA